MQVGAIMYEENEEKLGWDWLNLLEPCWTMLNHVEPCWTMLNHVEPCWTCSCETYFDILTLSVFLCDRPCNQHQSASISINICNTVKHMQCEKHETYETDSNSQTLWHSLTLLYYFCLFCSSDCWTARRVSLPRSMAPRSRWSQSQNRLWNEERYRKMIKTYITHTYIYTYNRNTSRWFQADYDSGSFKVMIYITLYFRTPKSPTYAA